MSILDSVFAATEARYASPVIISENHANNDGCHKLATIDGKVALVVAGEDAWHGLGVQVRDALTSKQAIVLGGLNTTNSKTQLQYTVNGTTYNIPDQFAITNDTTGECYGIVGNNYKIIQNAEAFEFLDSVLGEFNARYETAGALFGGRKTFMQVRLPKELRLGSADSSQFFATFTNSHDGKSAAYCYASSTRIVCNNTFRMSMSDKDSGLRIVHTGDIKRKIECARKALGLAVQAADSYIETAETMAKTPLAPRPYFENLLDRVLEVTALQAMNGPELLAATLDISEKQAAKRIKDRSTAMEDLLTRYESKTNTIGGMTGTAWAAFNTATESTQHGTLGGFYRGDDKDSRRFESNMNGDADQIKQIAYQMALAN